MEEKQKKQLIALLLFISCLVSSLWLIFTPKTASMRLHSPEQADSLIVRDLNRYGITDEQIHIRSVKMDSLHTRKVYRVSVPPGFSKTHLHQEFSHTFFPFDVTTPAAIMFPEKDMTIHLVHRHTVFRSIEIRTNADLVMKHNYGSLLVAFNGVPPVDLVEEIISFGEPIPLALIITSPVEASEMNKRLENRYSRIMYWLKDEEGNNVLGHEVRRALPRLQHLGETVPGASVLSFVGLSPSSSPDNIELLSETSLRFVDASEAIILDADTGLSVFQQELNKFVQKARRNEHPIAIVRGNRTSLNLLQKELAEFKKAGLEIVLPSLKRF